MHDDTPTINYIALLDSLKQDDQWKAAPSEITYAFHTFSLRNEAIYEPTGDVTFVSPNPDPRDLDGGVERLIDAVLHLPVKAFVIGADDLQHILESHNRTDTVQLAPGVERSYDDLQALLAQANTTHPHNH